MQRNLLGEVVIIRPVLILSIVIGHAFAIYSGAWIAPEYIEHVKWYESINPIFINFQLAAFVFISGYLFEFKKNKVNEPGFVMHKFKRLMIPALIFGTVYYFCFAFDRSGMPFLFIVKIFGGVGHLWFLPMLFWCFVATWLLRNYMIDEKILVVLLVVLSLLPLPIPLGIGNMLHYGIYFYMGMLAWNKRGMIIDKWLALKVMLPVGLLYIVSLFAFLNRSSFFIEGNDALVIKGINYMIDNVVRLVVNVSGIFIIYLIVVKFVNEGGGKIYNWTYKANVICYGVYIIHQFVLQYLYYKTTLPLKIEAVYLPWLVLALALGISVILSACMLKTRLGRYLIG